MPLSGLAGTRRVQAWLYASLNGGVLAARLQALMLMEDLLSDWYFPWALLRTDGALQDVLVELVKVLPPPLSSRSAVPSWAAPPLSLTVCHFAVAPPFLAVCRIRAGCCGLEAGDPLRPPWRAAAPRRAAARSPRVRRRGMTAPTGPIATVMERAGALKASGRGRALRVVRGGVSAGGMRLWRCR